MLVLARTQVRTQMRTQVSGAHRYVRPCCESLRDAGLRPAVVEHVKRDLHVVALRVLQELKHLPRDRVLQGNALPPF